ncbi:MAG: type I pullulanase, partial [Traorella sp.]
MRKIRQFEAYLDDFTTIVIYLSKQSYEGVSRFFYLKDEKGDLEELTIQTVESTSNNFNKYTCKTKNEVEIGKEYFVIHEFARKCVLKMGYIVKQKAFDERFAYLKDDLGATYSKEKTIFKVWAPTAVKAALVIDDTCYPMTRSEKGVYEKIVEGDLEGKKYQYYLLVDGEWVSSEDPYGKSSLANSKYSCVIDSQKYQAKKLPLPEMKSYTDAIIYEMNVRDFTAQNLKNDFVHSKQYLGVVEENENTIKKKIGFSYLKELGVTHIQLMPVLDFASVDENHPSLFYNWGYDPAQFMTLEGSFCSNPNDPYSRIQEFSEMVNKLHESGLRVV